MIEKEFIQANDLVRNSFALARQIYDSGYRPDVLLVLWRGGTPVGIVVHEYLLYRGIKTHHMVVKAESYRGIGQRSAVRIEHLDPVIQDIPEGSKVLIVDDIFDTGCTMKRVVESLGRMASEVKTATLYCRTNSSGGTPDFYFSETDKWIVFPHELMDLTEAEIREKDEYIAGLL